MTTATSITEQQWVAVEEELKSHFGHAVFRFRDYQVSIYRSCIGEGRTALAVYINGKICGAWMNKDNPMFSLVTRLYCQRTKACYSAKTISKIEKAFGKRDAKKYYPNLHSRHTYYMPCFTKTSTLIRQYKKLDGLELVSIGGVDYE